MFAPRPTVRLMRSGHPTRRQGASVQRGVTRFFLVLRLISICGRRARGPAPPRGSLEDDQEKPGKPGKPDRPGKHPKPEGEESDPENELFNQASLSGFI